MRNHLWAAVSQGRLLIGAQSVDDVSNYRWFTLRTWSSAISLSLSLCVCLSIILPCPPLSPLFSLTFHPSYLALPVSPPLMILSSPLSLFSIWSHFHPTVTSASIPAAFSWTEQSHAGFVFWTCSKQMTWSKADLAASPPGTHSAVRCWIMSPISMFIFLLARTWKTSISTTSISPFNPSRSCPVACNCFFRLNAFCPQFFQWSIFCLYFNFFSFVVQPRWRNSEHSDGASSVHGRGKRGLAAPRNKWLDYLKPLPGSNSNT